MRTGRTIRHCPFMDLSPESGPTTARLRWARSRLLALAAGFAAALITAAAAETPVTASPWLVLTGTAAGGAALIAVAR